ncbi:MAG: PilZ domain-containing protein [Clostridia bacterium]|nr:PilZ domain-containing protein [Clostridia bacterium]
MNEIKLTLGTKLELELYNNNGERIMPFLVSQFETRLPDGTIEILAPISEGRIYPVHRGTKMDVVFERNGDLKKFSALALERKMAGNIYLLHVQPTSGEEHLQRRNFFRFNCLVDMKYRMFEDKATKNEDRGEFKKAITKDVSGGGICMLTNEKPNYGWCLEGRINLSSEVKFLGRIVRIINVHDKAKFDYEVGLEFIEISNMEREKIISYIFESQRKLLKKGWSTR